MILALLLLQAITTIQTSAPTYTNLGIIESGIIFTVQPGQTIRWGNADCTVAPLNGPSWHYITNTSTIAITFSEQAPWPAMTAMGDPTPYCSHEVDVQNPSTFAPVSNAYSCALRCVYQTTVTDPMAVTRTYNSDEYVDTLLMQESAQWWAAKNVLQNAINTAAGASAIAYAKAALAAVELALALAHGSLSSAPVNFKVIDGRFIWIMSGTPVSNPPQ